MVNWTSKRSWNSNLNRKTEAVKTVIFKQLPSFCFEIKTWNFLCKPICLSFLGIGPRIHGRYKPPIPEPSSVHLKRAKPDRVKALLSKEVKISHIISGLVMQVVTGSITSAGMGSVNYLLMKVRSTGNRRKQTLLTTSLEYLEQIERIYCLRTWEFAVSMGCQTELSKSSLYWSLTITTLKQLLLIKLNWILFEHVWPCWAKLN